MQNKTFISCKCGSLYTTNTFLQHINNKCNMSENEKQEARKLANLSKLNRHAWLKSEGEEAVSFGWLTQVLTNKIRIEDLTFISPRKVGEMRMSSRKKISRERRGVSNPQSRMPSYTLEEIEKKAVIIFKEIELNPVFTIGFLKTIKIKLNKELPEWIIGLCVKNKKGTLLTGEAIIKNLLIRNHIDVESFILKARGQTISAGQKNSPECLLSAAKMALKNGKPRVSKPQKRLYELFLKKDPSCVLEKHIKLENTIKKYDVYSHKYNALIEMHGHIWHSSKNVTKSLKKIVAKNIENDTIKQKAAIDLGYNFWVFWDDQENNWESEIERNILNAKIKD